MIKLNLEKISHWESVFVFVVALFLLCSCQIFSQKASDAAANYSCPATSELSQDNVALEGPKVVSSNSCIRFKVRLGDGLLLDPDRALAMDYRCKYREFEPKQANQKLQVSLIGDGQGKFFSDDNCQKPVSSVSIEKGQSTAAVYFQSSSTGFRNIGISEIQGEKLAFYRVEVSDRTPTELHIDGPQKVSAGRCVRYRVQQRDAAGNPTSVSVPTMAGLDVVGAIGKSFFYKDSNCQQESTEVRIPAGASNTDFYFRKESNSDKKLYLLSHGQGSGLGELRPGKLVIYLTK